MLFRKKRNTIDQVKTYDECLLQIYHSSMVSNERLLQTLRNTHYIIFFSVAKENLQVMLAAA